MVESAIARNGWLDEDEDAPTTAPGSAHPGGRVVLSSEVTISSESQFFAGLTGDVLEGGVFIATYRRLDIGCRVAVSLSLPAGDLELLGVVEWIRDAYDGVSPGVGIGFEDLSVEARAGIEAFCRLRAPLYHESATRRFQAVAE
jgi:uncharacterized protein (TIGR02266 family)